MKSALVSLLLLSVASGCGGSADPSSELGAAADTLPALEDAAPIDFSQPRPIAVIWKEVIGRRAEIDRLFAEEKILEIADVAERILLMTQELRGVGRDFDHVHQVRLLRLLNATMFVIGAVQEVARVQIPGALPLVLWEMDGALVDLEEVLPATLRDGQSYPRPSAKPPV